MREGDFASPEALKNLERKPRAQFLRETLLRLNVHAMCIFWTSTSNI